MTIDTVFLDAGGVLVVPRMEEVIASLGLTNTVDELLDAYAVATNYLSHGESESTRSYRIWSSMFDHIEHSLQAEFITDYLQSIGNAQGLWYPPTAAPGVREQLQRLVDAGLRLAVLSNSDGTIEKSLREAGICQVGPGDGVPVEAVIDSGAVMVEKPDPRIFEMLLDACGTTRDRVVHVGDSLLQDMHGARDAGIAGIHLDRSGACNEPDHQHAKSFEAVVDLIFDRFPSVK